MTERANQLLAEVLRLPPAERVEFAERILESFDDPQRRALDAEWAAEIERRIAAYERGEVTAIPAEEVFAAINQRGHGRPGWFPMLLM